MRAAPSPTAATICAPARERSRGSIRILCAQTLMPAPIASAMQQLARLKFTSFGLKVPQNWRDPSGEAGDHYGKAFKPEEKMTQPGMPMLFQPVCSAISMTGRSVSRNSATARSTRRVSR